MVVDFQENPDSQEAFTEVLRKGGVSIHVNSWVEVMFGVRISPKKWCAHPIFCGSD